MVLSSWNIVRVRKADGNLSFGELGAKLTRNSMCSTIYNMNPRHKIYI